MSYLKRKISTDNDFVKLSEKFITKMLYTLLSKELGNRPLIEFCMHVEEELYHKVCEDYPDGEKYYLIYIICIFSLSFTMDIF